MSINKVIYGNQTLIDITDTDATATTVQSGKKFYNAAGNLVVGTGSALGHETELLPNGGTAHYINGIDLGSDTVDAAHLATGYTAHDSTGTAIVGTMGGGGTLKIGVIRPDAELVRTWSKDSLWVTNDSGTIPTYSTTTQTLHTGAAITPTETLDLNTYRYVILSRSLTIPIYNTTANEVGKPEYAVYTSLYEVTEFPINSIPSLDGTSTNSSQYVMIQTTGSIYRAVYWGDNLVLYASNSTSYGVHQTLTTPTISPNNSTNPTLTIKDPSLKICGSKTQFTESAWGKMTDIRYQYIIELYRVAKATDSISGWGLYSQFNHIIDCVKTTNHKLT